jgi:dTDP-3-amino-3,4,6-trideoxy-alpha-D-glucose transaminase
MAVPLFDTSTPLAAIDAEIRAKVNAILDAGTFVLGPEVRAFEAEFAAYVGARHAVGVANGTDALLLALRALGVGPGDEVIVPSFTFYASAEAIPHTGARPVFCDIDPETFVLTPEAVRAVMTPRTKAVIAVHLFGNVAPVEAIEALGVGARSYYRTPAHMQPAMRPYLDEVDLLGTEEASRTNLAVPMSAVLGRAEADEVVAAAGALAAE